MDENYIDSIITRILNRNFTDSRKRKTVVYPKNRIQMACPYCGDSHKNPNAKRGNLYFNRLMSSLKGSKNSSSKTSKRWN